MKIVIPSLILLILLGCSGNKTYLVSGTIIEIRVETNIFIIHHDEIPGFMMSMTMPFSLQDSSDITRFSVGDSVHFKLMMGKDQAVAANFQLQGQGIIPDSNDDWNDKYIPLEIGEIFDKVYIHLHSESIPEAGLIMDELTDPNQRNKLAEIIFDLEKLEFSLASAHDLVKRLEESWINIQLKTFRRTLKNAETSRKDPASIMKKIEDLQAQKKNLLYQNETNK